MFTNSVFYVLLIVVNLRCPAVTALLIP